MKFSLQREWWKNFQWIIDRNEFFSRGIESRDRGWTQEIKWNHKIGDEETSVRAYLSKRYNYDAVVAGFT